MAAWDLDGFTWDSDGSVWDLADSEVIVGLPAEIDTALLVTRVKTVSVGLPAEVSAALAVAAGRAILVGLPAAVTKAIPNFPSVFNAPLTGLWEEEGAERTSWSSE